MCDYAEWSRCGGRVCVRLSGEWRRRSTDGGFPCGCVVAAGRRVLAQCGSAFAGRRQEPATGRGPRACLHGAVGVDPYAGAACGQLRGRGQLLPALQPARGRAAPCVVRWAGPVGEDPARVLRAPEPSCHACCVRYHQERAASARRSGRASRLARNARDLEHVCQERGVPVVVRQAGRST